MPTATPEEKVAPKVNDYLTDGKNLVLVIQADENGLLVEDARNERPFRLLRDELPGWDHVPLREIV
jgi:hypothetical protein